MSYNIDSIETLRSTLRMGAANLKKARRLRNDMPEINPLTWPEKLPTAEDGEVLFPEVHFCGESSGTAYRDGVLEKFFKLTEGEADLVLTWEGGDLHTGLRIRDGKMTECGVVMALEPEE